MRRQIQKSSKEGSPHNQEFPEPPNTPSFSYVKSKQNDDVDTDQLSFENLRSFYRELCEEEMAKISRNASFQSESPDSIVPSRRAIYLSTDSASTSTSTSTSASASPSATAAEGASFSSGSTIPTAVEVEGIVESERDVVVIVTYSRSLCEDFRRSMEEIVAARVESEGEVNREFMEELLFRYLELNNDKYFRDILRAFLGLIGVSHEDPAPRRQRRLWAGGFSKRKLKLDIKRMQKLCCKYL